ncbi:energy transducer TonB [Pseudomonadota bacterium AL_CKDN230030165-1A_HGKHYDSX7]
MPSIQSGRNTSQVTFALRAGAGSLVVAAHAAVVGAIFFATPDSPPVLLEPEAVMVSVIEAPTPQVAKAEPTPEPPQPPVEEPPPPPPEPEIEPEPEPEPEIEPEPEPEPPPVIEKPPEPAPKPKPKPKPKPQPKPQPKPDIKPEPKPETPPTPPTGAPEGAQVTQAPRQGPPPDEAIMLSQVEYVGARPAPTYPMSSQRLKEEGRVVVLVEINTQGTVDKASIDSSSGYSRLDESALSAARKARFKPLMRNGVALPAKAKLPFDFVLRK